MAPPKDSLLLKFYYQATMAIGFAGCVGVSNNYNKRPFFSGLQRHALAVALGILVGTYVDKYAKKRWSERDAMIRHYIELHPEDFNEKKRKYKEVFDEWYPLR